MEKRIGAGTHELRASKNADGSMRVSGYAATYNTLSNELGANTGKFRERIAPRAFDSILRTNPDVVATLNHSLNHVLGRTSAGTLQLLGDDTGLKFRCDMAPTSYGKDLYESVKRGDMNSCSFAFELGERSDEEWNEEEIEDEKDLALRGKRQKQLVRTIKNFKALHDVAIVTNAAYPGTSVDARMELVSAEARSFAEHRLNPKPSGYYYCPNFTRSIERLEAFNKEHGGNFSLGEMHDVLERNHEARRKMLASMLD